MAAKRTPAAKLKALKQKASAAKAKQRARAESLLALIARRKARIVEDFYDIGQALRELLRGELYRALGYKSFEDLLRARDIMSAVQARKLITVVERVPRDQALQLGSERAYALVAYTAATPEPDVPAELVRADARINGKRLSTASKRDINEAAKAARKKAAAGGPATAAERATEKEERAITLALRAALKSAGISGATITMGRDEITIKLARAAAAKLLRVRPASTKG